ncbi:MAG: hypothetical protein P1R58_10945 [bacterium]|nr:hypothetical protein [bacterium]
MSQNRDDELVLFIDGNRTMIDRLFERIVKRRDQLMTAATRRGDTEFEKGQVTELNWCVTLPDRIINESQISADT